MGYLDSIGVCGCEHADASKYRGYLGSAADLSAIMARYPSPRIGMSFNNLATRSVWLYDGMRWVNTTQGNPFTMITDVNNAGVIVPNEAKSFVYIPKAVGTVTFNFSSPGVEGTSYSKTVAIERISDLIFIEWNGVTLSSGVWQRDEDAVLLADNVLLDKSGNQIYPETVSDAVKCNGGLAENLTKELLEHQVSTREQSFDSTKQTQARKNIAAVGVAPIGGITQLIDGNGQNIYPQTKSSEVKVDDSKYLDVKLTELDVLKLSNLFVDDSSSTIDKHIGFIREIYAYGSSLDKNETYMLANIARNKNGFWYIRIEDSRGNRYFINPQTEPNGIINVANQFYMVVDWSIIDDGSQIGTNIVLSDKIFDVNYSPSIKAFIDKADIQSTLDYLGFRKITAVYVNDKNSAIMPSFNTQTLVFSVPAQVMMTEGSGHVIVTDTILDLSELFDGYDFIYIFYDLNLSAFVPKKGNNIEYETGDAVYLFGVITKESISINSKYWMINSVVYSSDNTEVKEIGNNSNDSLIGYINTNKANGDVHPSLVIGQPVTLEYHRNFKYVKIPVVKNEIVYIPKIPYHNYGTANPVVVDINNILLEYGNSVNAETFIYSGSEYWKYTVQNTGYLLLSWSKSFTVYSENPTLRRSLPHTLSLEEKEKIHSYLGIEQLESSIPYDYEVAINMNKATLRSMIETASNGSCTVLYDNNGYPNLMYKIPLMTTGVLAPTLGDMETPHPAFMVGGVQKRHIYAAVFMNAEYNGVPVSWFGLGSIMRSKSFLECRTLCAEKGAGWHLETMWERSLISLLSMKHHGTKPRGNNCWGRSKVSGYEYECVERVDGRYPGQESNGCQWYNGTQPNSWSHNNSRWGIFDVIGGYHEWCNLAKVVDGQIYLMLDNDYSSDESEWTATGVYIGLDNGQVAYSNEQFPLVTSITSKKWVDAVCLSGYDNISEDMRKKLALSFMCPRLSSQDTEAIFDFNGAIWVRRLDQSGYTTYPFCGGAEEYANCGLGFNILSYDGNEAHNNMGSRLFYIE